MTKNRIVLAALLIFTLVAPLTSHANLQFNVSLNTTLLVGNPNGPFTMDFQLNDGSGINDANNTARLSNFSFGGGAASGSPTILGGVSGGVNSTVSLIDSSFLNFFDQTFNSGGTLSFDVVLTTNVDSGPTPDGFFFSLIDGAGNLVPTTGLLSTFLEVDLDSGSPAIQAFGGVGTYAGIGTPTITAIGGGPSPIPEPGTVWLLCLGLLGASFVARPPGLPIVRG